MLPDITTQAIEKAYDAVPYPSVSHSLSHPDRLAAVALLLGMKPAPVQQCRVLELGCASGGNLIPMAYALPHSHFVGLDLSPRQIDQGRAMLTALNLPNITLTSMDLLDVTTDLGQFDYIIAHGVYSWVPVAVRDKLLSICRENLAPQGVAYISYNTYPGWNMLGTLRQMMLYHTRQAATPRDRADQARALLDFLTRSIATDQNSHGGFLYVYTNYIKDYFLPKDDAFLLHDELAEVNEPVYFYEFAEQAAQHGLTYLGDADFSTMLATNFPPSVTADLRQLAKSTVELEQYMDFLRNRMFRQSLLCHQAVKLNPQFRAERLAKLYFASTAQPESPAPNIEAVSVEKFIAPNGATLATDHPVTKAAMLHLIDLWPQSASLDTLLMAARARLSQSAQPNPAADVSLLAANLLKAYGHSEHLVELHTYQPPLTRQVNDRPVASPVARYQAEHGDSLTNLRHERVTLDKVALALLPYLDGQHDQAALVDILLEKDLLEVERQDQQPITGPAEVKKVLAEVVNTKLNQFAEAALLVG